MPTTALTGANPVLRRTAFLLAAVIVTSWLTGCERMRLDREVDRLCAIDGGVKVFETVEVSQEVYADFLRSPARPLEVIFGANYHLKSSTEVLVDGNPSMLRFVRYVIRQTDGKVLGQVISYARVGGDLPGLSHPSSYGCPPTEQLYLEHQVFVKKGESK